ncbi:50S ribosomal protein L32 [Fonticula alba]|uniref:50S ribosomal protein L32 n=1 Tax=Fonticula alba TaxID=691883 RepID=A0A058Z5H0_FONAL|nr:50S ribosomal protein L32 [Fonticula alba]KCV68782.1 50S ribosomal protein L32 [Fonticula alba]|eukprot:XP_009496353.1 50S ribosomal protein L32 [Fonticula alba]
MVAATVPHKKIVKKHSKPFYRYHWHRYNRLGRQETWRKDRGIDSRMRRRFKGMAPQVSIGFGSDKATKFLRPDGYKTFVVNNVKDLDILIMSNHTYAAEVAHNVSAAKRVGIVERAKELGIKVTNPNARVRSEESA